jgi:hypothetical protein
VKLDFELPLTAYALLKMPSAVRAAADALAVLENGITESDISLEFDASVDIYQLAEHDTPIIKLPSCKLTGLVVFRPTPAEGEATDRFLWFTTTVSAEGPFGRELVGWALENMGCTVFMRTHEIQGVLPGMEPDEKAANDAAKKEAVAASKKAKAEKGKGKAAAAGDKE